MNPEHRLEMMTKMLNLSTDQQAAIRQIFADEQAKMEAQRSSGQPMSQQDRRAAMMAMRQDQTAKIEAVLTPDQKTKYEAMEAKMRERMQEHRDGGTPPPPPPQ
jgi:protein CpxP